MSKITPMYTTSVSVTGGREGHAVSDDGVLDLDLRRPKLNGVADGTNPEQLFAAAWAGCLQSALFAVGRRAGVDLTSATVVVEVAQGKEADGEGFGLAAKLTMEMPGIDHSQAEELAQAAHSVCPYSKAVRGNIETELVVR